MMNWPGPDPRKPRREFNEWELPPESRARPGSKAPAALGIVIAVVFAVAGLAVVAFMVAAVFSVFNNFKLFPNK